MTANQATVLAPRVRRSRVQHPKPRRGVPEKVSKPLPEYIEMHEVNALVRAAPNPRNQLPMLVQWKVGLRVSEALEIETRDLSLDTDRPTIRVRQGKGSRARIVPVHGELHAALTSALQFGNIGQVDRLVRASRSTVGW